MEAIYTMEEEPSRVNFTIFGEPASKANSRRWTGKYFIKSSKALKYVDQFKAQCPVLNPLMSGDLCVSIKIWYASRRPDLDESLILDCMQGKIYENDRSVKERHVFWALDKKNPRAEITVEKIKV
jgi:Holliday junction resolvase RusA-like endonuclease